jgi:hypothetical protein
MFIATAGVESPFAELAWSTAAGVFVSATSVGATVQTWGTFAICFANTL